jgi:SOS-response transcriptional repressor LexA
MISANRTNRQNQALAFIVSFQRETGGVSPSLAQIAAAIGAKSRSQTKEHIVDGLIERGLIRRGKYHSHRSIEVLARPVVAYRFNDINQRLEVMAEWTIPASAPS